MRRSRPVPAGSGMPGSIAGRPRPASATRAAEELGAREVVAAAGMSPSAGLEVGGDGDQLAQRVRAQEADSSSASSFAFASLIAPRANVEQRRARLRPDRRVAPERERALRRSPSGSVGQLGRLLVASSAIGCERVVRDAPAAAEGGRVEPARRRPSRRRSAGRRAAGPRPSASQTHDGRVDAAADRRAAGRRCRRRAASPCAARCRARDAGGSPRRPGGSRSRSR